MPLLLCCLLMAGFTSATHSFPSTTNCSGGGEMEFAVAGWPVLAAFLVPALANVTMDLLKLSHNNVTHTSVTLTHMSLVGRAGLASVTVESSMAPKLTASALVADNSWTTLKLNVRHKKLELRMASEALSHTYSTTAYVYTTTGHLSVSTIRNSCSNKCVVEIDLRCLDGSEKHTGEPTASPGTEHSNSIYYYWPFYVMVILLVIVCVLFTVWWHEHMQIRRRRLHQSRMARRIPSIQERNSMQASEGDRIIRGLRPGSSEVRYSLGYDGPCTGDTD